MTEALIHAGDRLNCRTSIRNMTQIGNSVAVLLEDDIVRAAQGGQPQDQGVVTIRDRSFSIGQVFRAVEGTWITLKGASYPAAAEHDEVIVAIDGSKRQAFARSHTLGHLLTAALSRALEDFSGKGVDIDDTGIYVRVLFQTTSKLDRLALNMIDCMTRSLIARDASVHTTTVSNLEEGGRQFRRWRADDDLTTPGDIRVVEIADIDASPCSGSHVRSTAEVGPYRLHHNWTQEQGVYRLAAERTSTWTYWFGEQALIDFDWSALHLKNPKRAK